MAENDRFSVLTRGRSEGVAVEFDEGLRKYMLGVYNYMAFGLALTGVVAFMVSQAVVANPALAGTLYSGPLGWVIMLSPLAFILVLSFGISRLSLPMTQLLFWAFAAVMGVSLSSIFLVYTGNSIARVFFITAIMFGSISLWGYTTKRDISGWGSFLFMGLIGLIVASLVNLFLQSSAIQFAVSVIGVLVFAGLTAYDTQRIKQTYYMVEGDAVAMGKTAVSGALHLYLDFINLFLMLLRLFGNRN